MLVSLSLSLSVCVCVFVMKGYVFLSLVSVLFHSRVYVCIVAPYLKPDEVAEGFNRLNMPLTEGQVQRVFQLSGADPVKGLGITEFSRAFGFRIS